MSHAPGLFRLSRRQFVQGVGLIGVGLVAGCGRLPWQAQPPPKVPQIGFLWGGRRAAIQERVDAFLQGLEQYGNVDVIVVPGLPATRAAKSATSMIPIVMTVINDPIGTGLVASLGRPGGNIT